VCRYQWNLLPVHGTRMGCPPGHHPAPRLVRRLISTIQQHLALACKMEMGSRTDLLLAGVLACTALPGTHGTCGGVTTFAGCGCKCWVGGNG
jgi:hypothetical protein